MHDTQKPTRAPVCRVQLRRAERPASADLPDRAKWPNARRALVLADQERLDRDLARPVTSEEIRQATEWVLRPLTQFDDEPTQPGLGRPWERPL